MSNATSQTKLSNGSSVSAPLPSSGTTNGTTNASNLLPHAPHYTLRRTLPNTPLSASLISAGLSALGSFGLAFAAIPVLRRLGAFDVDSLAWGWAKPILGLYCSAMGLFHLSEFWTTAGWNVQKLSVDAFLLNNTTQYWIAHAVGLFEYFISVYFLPRKFASWYCSFPFLFIVIALLIAGQSLRSLAMIHANASFSHVVKQVKHDDHVLITHGVYAYSRHPSYVGFFYWAIATQLLLGNVVSTLGFVVVLGRFFSHRIRDEEKHLIKFFGSDYVQYSQRVGTGLPFFLNWL